MAQTTAVLIYDLNPPPTLLSVPPALRARPHTGALNHRLLLLVLCCGGFIAAAMPIEGKGPLDLSLLPHPLTLSQPLTRRRCFRFRAPVKGRARRAGVTSMGGWVGKNIPQAERQSVRQAIRREGERQREQSVVQSPQQGGAAAGGRGTARGGRAGLDEK